MVEFADANLEREVRDEIDKPDGVLCKEDVEGILFLRANGEDIVDLSGIQFLTSLTNRDYVDLSKNPIDEIEQKENIDALCACHVDLDPYCPLPDIP